MFFGWHISGSIAGTLDQRVRHNISYPCWGLHDTIFKNDFPTTIFQTNMQRWFYCHRLELSKRLDYYRRCAKYRRYPCCTCLLHLLLCCWHWNKNSRRSEYLTKTTPSNALSAMRCITLCLVSTGVKKVKNEAMSTARPKTRQPPYFSAKIPPGIWRKT